MFVPFVVTTARCQIYRFWWLQTIIRMYVFKTGRDVHSIWNKTFWFKMENVSGCNTWCVKVAFQGFRMCTFMKFEDNLNKVSKLKQQTWDFPFSPPRSWCTTRPVDLTGSEPNRINLHVWLQRAQEKLNGVLTLNLLLKWNNLEHDSDCIKSDKHTDELSDILIIKSCGYNLC